MNSVCGDFENTSNILHEIDFSQCRLCQENDGTIEFLTNSVLFERIKLCTRLNFEDDKESLPKFICKTCNQLLINFFLFQENCLKIDEQLKKLLEKKLQEELNLKTEKVATKRTVKRPVLKKREPLLNSICNKCGEPRKKTRHTCKIVKPEELNHTTEDVSVKTETDELVTEIKCSDTEEKWIKTETTCESSTDLISDDIEDEKPAIEDDFKADLNDDLPSETSKNEKEAKPSKVKKPRKKKDVKQPESYSCPVSGCTKTCPNKGALRSHKYHQHGIRKFLCTVCGKSFRALCNLKSHEAVHLQTKPFQCPKCTMRFGYATNLKVHIKNHHEGHRYYCTKCGKAFLTSCTLKRHELIHVGRKDFKCDICPSAFYTQKELIKHKKYHYDIRAYFCNICYKSFVAKDHLTVHMRSHTGERPYVCDVSGCGQGFVTSGKVRRHQRTVHHLNL